MDLVTGARCAICGASFPESWKRPVYCNHKHPGRDWGQSQQVTATVRLKASHWTPLHQYPVDHWTSWNPQAAAKWFAGWRSRISNYGCACRDNFNSYLAMKPPDYSSAEAFFQWTVEAHNYVSLNHLRPPKPPMTIEKARQLWHSVDPDQFDSRTYAQCSRAGYS